MMSIRGFRNVSFAMLIAAMTGCTGDSNAPPMATDGPNQVVLKVPGMS
jgi:hypothetical protein